jgi:hypothetical protein
VQERPQRPGNGPSQRIDPCFIGKIFAPDLSAQPHSQVAGRAGTKGPRSGGITEGQAPLEGEVRGVPALEVLEHSMIPHIGADLPAGLPGERKERFGELGLDDVAITQMRVQGAEPDPAGEEPRLPEDRGQRGAIGITLVAEAGECGGAEHIELFHADRGRHLRAGALDVEERAGTPAVGGGHSYHQARVAAQGIDPNAAEHGEEAEVSLGLGHLGRVVGLARTKQKLATHDPFAGHEVKPVGEPGEKAGGFGRVEDVVAANLDRADDVAGISGGLRERGGRHERGNGRRRSPAVHRPAPSCGPNRGSRAASRARPR